MIKNFIFDIDGTLLNTYDKYMPAMIEALGKYGYMVSLPKRLEKSCYGITADDALQKIGVKAENIEKIEQEWMRLADSREDLVSVFSKIPEALFELKNRNVKLAIATSRTRKDYDKNFADIYDWARIFSVVVTADQTQRHKPFPDPLLLALKGMDGVPNETVYVGDTVNDLKAARAAGVQFAGALYGSARPQELRNADYLLRAPSDLLTILA